MGYKFVFSLLKKKSSSYCGNHKEDTKSWYSGAEKADLEREMIDPKLLMNMKKMLSGDWNAKYYQIF